MSECIEDQMEDIIILKYIFDHMYANKRGSNKELFKSRDEHGFYASGLDILKDKNPELIVKSIRMTYDSFKALLYLVSPKLTKHSQRKPIEPEQRLYITLCFLAHGVSLHVISMKFRIGLETARSIVLETCDVLWGELAKLYVSAPTENDWKEIAADYNKN